MKDFKFKINGNEYNVEIEDVVENIAHIQVNGAKYEVEMEKRVDVPRPAPVRKSGGSDVAHTKTAQPAAASTNGVAIKSPLPGVIMRIPIRVGDVVKKGQTVIVMEAMKMENNISSECDGTISAIRVTEGQAVLQGDLLIEVC